MRHLAVESFGRDGINHEKPRLGMDPVVHEDLKRARTAPPQARQAPAPLQRVPVSEGAK
jgi:hypothetical protein